MTQEPLSPSARKTWALLATLGLVGAGFLLALQSLVGLVSTAVLGVILVFLLAPGSGRTPQPRDARLLARHARWEAGWDPSNPPLDGPVTRWETRMRPVQ
jgi:hypothetical protein